LFAAGLLLAGAVPLLAGTNAPPPPAPVPAWAVAHVSTAMCQGTRLHLVTTGVVAVAFEQVYHALMRSNVLEEVAAVYHQELPAGEKPALVVTPLAGPPAGRYAVDWQTKRAQVRDVWRQTDTNSFFEGGYVMTGQRYFGAFETVLVVHVKRTPAGQAAFRADVLIYPHNGMVRFSVKHLLPVDAYFRKIMQELGAKIRHICTVLSARVHAAPGHGAAMGP
jgi:hypothetical protein